MVPQAKGAVILLLISCIITISCSKNKNNMPLVPVDVHTIPMVHTTDVSTLVSDSGITPLRMKAKVWDIYSDAANRVDSFWHFPMGIFVEQFDSLFHVIGSIVADTAYFYERTKLWRAAGNVIAKNSEGTTFETSELFWDQNVPANSMYAFYSHKQVKITYPEGSIQNAINGFRANQSLNPIFLFSVEGPIYIKESTDTVSQNTNRPDSLRRP